MATKARKTPYAKCPECGKNVRLKPAGGDWLNDIYFIAHKNHQGATCENYRAVKLAQIVEPKR